MKAIRYIIEGRVQGVGFRYFTENAAHNLGIAGWVRNRPEGDVECVALADDNKLEEFESRLWQGPPAGQVNQIEKEEVPLNELGAQEKQSFRIR